LARLGEKIVSFRERLTDRDLFELRVTSSLLCFAGLLASAIVAVGRDETVWSLPAGLFAALALILYHRALALGAQSGAPDVRAWCRRALGMRPVEEEVAEAETLWRARVAAFLAELERQSASELAASAQTPHFQSVWYEKGRLS
jgi:hypothetical protein